jgi:hypothetical protein
VEILATVIAEPASDHQIFAENTLIKSAASDALESLHPAMDPDEYEQALADGSSKTYRIVAKGLIDTIRTDAFRSTLAATAD